MLVTVKFDESNSGTFEFKMKDIEDVRAFLGKAKGMFAILNQASPDITGTLVSATIDGKSVNPNDIKSPEGWLETMLTLPLLGGLPPLDDFGDFEFDDGEDA